MHIPVYQSISLAVHTAAFGALNYSDNLNDLTSRLTGGRVTRNTLAEAVLHQAIGLGLGIASAHKAVDKYAESIAGITGAELIEYADQILRGADDEQFSASVKELLTHTLKKQTAAGNIPDSAKEPAINLAQTLLNDYIGKQAIHQFLGVYAQNHGWDSLSEKIKNAVVPEESDTYRSQLILAGVGAGTGFIRALVDRAILQNPAFHQDEKFHAKPELTLAAGCLHAYLVNPENCIEALNNYTPTKPLINEPFLRNVADLTTAFAAKAHSDAKNVLEEAQKALEKENATFPVQAQSPVPALQMQEPESAAQSDVDKEIADFLLVDASDDGIDENKGALSSAPISHVAQSKVRPTESSEEAAGISDFVELETSAQMAVKDAKKAYEQATKFKAMNQAIGVLLVTDMDKRNAARIREAVDVLLQALPAADFGIRKSLASILSETTQLPAQNTIGTYVALNDWDRLAALLENVVERNLEHMEKKAVERAAKKAERDAVALRAQQAANEYAAQWANENPNNQNAALRIPEAKPEQVTQRTETATANDLKKPPVQGEQQTEKKEASWVRRAIPKLAVKIALQHLRPYIDGGDFKHPQNPEYKALANLLDVNQNELHGGFSAHRIALNSVPVTAQYAAERTVSGVQYVGNTALDYATSAAQTGAAVVGARVQTIGEQIMAAGSFATALMSPAVKVAATDGGFVAGLWNRINPFAAAPDKPVAVIPTGIQNDTLSTSVFPAGI
ncbi:hypothetical protein [Bordetella muralis]|uniref:hypothetical protein n=1 Tax=Bordetella muralis TaxID=1649130 RepID=UPI0039F012C9